MKQGMMLRLYKDTELKRFIMAQASRHFSEPIDREDAASEAWEAIIKRPACTDPREFARRFIHSYYMRKWRLRKKERVGL